MMRLRSSFACRWLTGTLLLTLLSLGGFVHAETLTTRVTPTLGTPPLPTAAEVAARPQPRRTSAYDVATSGLTVDLSQRESSRNFYQTTYKASENVPSGWSGNTAKGIAGTTSQAFKDSVALRVNYFRAMAGVFAAVTLSPELSLKDQQAALMMSANRQLSHAPTSAWSFYSADGAEAAGHSNISLGVNGPTAITGYIQDPGDGNTAVGHRRWIFYPTTSMMASGDVDGSFSTPYYPANALWVYGGGAAPASSAMRDGFVAWPPPGFVPYSLVFSRWSLTYPNADFSQANVTMTRNGQTIPTQLATVANGYADNTLVWIPSDQNTSGAEGTLPKPAQDTATTVTVANVIVGGAARTFTYQVTAYDPEVAGPVAVVPVINSASSVSAGVNTPFSYQITALNQPTSFSAKGLPTGLTLNSATGVIAGTPTQIGVSAVEITATNADGNGTMVLNLSVANLPTVTLTATVPTVTAGSGGQGAFTVTLSAAQDHKVAVNFSIKGTAVNGTDYALLPSTQKIKAGKVSKSIKVTPLGTGGGAGVKRAVTIKLLKGDGYVLGATTRVKLKIVGQ